jgi:hypothetical protein
MGKEAEKAADDLGKALDEAGEAIDKEVPKKPAAKSG